MNGIKRTINPLFLGVIAICCVFIVLSGCTSQQAAVKAGDTVKVYYTVSFPGGMIFESNKNATPLEFTVGSGMMVPGFEEAVVGMSPGQTKTITVPVEKAYGPYNPDLVNTESTDAVRSTLAQMANKSPEQINLSDLGLIIWEQPDGKTGYIRLSNITPNTVTVDENHPLAGKDLVFEITLAEIVNKTG